VKIDLNMEQVDIVSKNLITVLKKEKKTLQNKVTRLEDKLRVSQTGMDCTRETRHRIRGLAYDLYNELDSASWSNYDE